MKNRRQIAAAASAVLLLAGCGDAAGSAATATRVDTSLPQGKSPVTVDPADFSVEITNSYWPMPPGRRWTYVERDLDGSEATVVIIVTKQTKVLANGVAARVVRDTVTKDGEVIEDTLDYFAQDRAGNIWYFGEQTAEFDHGKVTTTAGSFEAGVAGALPGIAVPADPVAGMAYRQEYLKGEAEDNGQVLSIDELAEVPAGSYRQALLTKDTTPLEPALLEYKLYAKGVGPVLVLTASGGNTRSELMQMDSAPADVGTGPLGTP